MNVTDFTNKDYFTNIAKYFQNYIELKMLSKINKSSNMFVKRETTFKSIVRDKKNKYYCDMLKYYLIKQISYELNNDYKKILNKVRKSVNNFRSLTDKESLYMTYKINACKYTNSMNKGCLPYLEYIISYYFNERNKNNRTNNDIHKASIQISKTLYNIILSIDNNYKLKDENIVLWLSNK
jgi:hypothetical protein